MDKLVKPHEDFWSLQDEQAKKDKALIHKLNTDVSQLEKQVKKLKKQKRTRTILSIICALALAISGLYIFAHDNVTSNNVNYTLLSDQDIKQRQVAQQSLVEALDWLKDNYYEALDYKTISDKMLFGALEKMENKFTRYLPEEEYLAFRENVGGQFFGIGVQVQPYNSETKEVGEENSEDTVVREEIIKRVFPNSPAEQAGLQVGDIIQTIDGKLLEEFENRRALINAVRGPAGTIVQVGIFRPDSKETLVFEIERGPITPPVTELKVLDDVAYIRLYEFTYTLPEQFEKVLNEVKEKGLKKVVFDMRYNPGGDAGALEQVLDMLLPEGLISTIEGRQDGVAYSEEWRTSAGQILDEDVQFAILMNGESASASEFFMGAMRDRLDVPLIGTSSYGKGVATVSLPLSNGGAINVTTFEYILPKGERLNGVGLSPTQEVELPEKYQMVDPNNIPENEDTQLLAALKYLRQK